MNDASPIERLISATRPVASSETHAVADLNPAAVKRLFLLGRAFHRHQGRAAPFAADREALNGAQRDEQQGNQPADGRKRRQQTDRRGGKAHHHHSENQHALAAKPVAEMAEHEAAERPDQKADAERGEAASVPIAGLTFGKNPALKTSAATIPYSKKSYQSTTAPTKLPSAALRARLRAVRLSAVAAGERVVLIAGVSLDSRIDCLWLSALGFRWDRHG
jgi:hypothetical protein